MSFSRTDVLVLGSSSSGSFTVPFVDAFDKPPKYVAVVGHGGLSGNQTLPMEAVLKGNPGGEVRIRVNSMTQTSVSGEILSNSLSPGQTVRINFFAKD